MSNTTHPMLYSPMMVQSLLNDTKNQTRRIIKGTALKWLNDGFALNYVADPANNLCPYGKIGDTIWVKETYYAYGYWQNNGVTETGKKKWRFVDETVATSINNGTIFLYEDCKPNIIIKNKMRVRGWYKRPSLFMPKIASRITLKITGIKIERLQDISEQDAIGEGILGNAKDGYKNYLVDGAMVCAIVSYETLWQKINGPESWQQNPYVWAIKFERV